MTITMVHDEEHYDCVSRRELERVLNECRAEAERELAEPGLGASELMAHGMRKVIAAVAELLDPSSGNS